MSKIPIENFLKLFLIFFLAVIMPYHLAVGENKLHLTSVTWQHAVNSHAKLLDALKCK